LPNVSFRLELLTPLLRQAIVFPQAAFAGLPPARADEIIVFQTMKHGVEHTEGPFQAPIGEAADVLDDLIPVAFPLLENGEKKRLGRGGDHGLGHHLICLPTLYTISLYIGPCQERPDTRRGDAMNLKRRPARVLDAGL
jgi:hypothetical protein